MSLFDSDNIAILKEHVVARRRVCNFSLITKGIKFVIGGADRGQLCKESTQYALSVPRFILQTFTPTYPSVIRRVFCFVGSDHSKIMIKSTSRICIRFKLKKYV
jgi:hypothetical protein